MHISKINLNGLVIKRKLLYKHRQNKDESEDDEDDTSQHESLTTPAVQQETTTKPKARGRPRKHVSPIPDETKPKRGRPTKASKALQLDKQTQRVLRSEKKSTSNKTQ